LVLNITKVNFTSNFIDEGKLKGNKDYQIRSDIVNGGFSQFLSKNDEQF
jgi:hypothetical protein